MYIASANSKESYALVNTTFFFIQSSFTQWGCFDDIEIDFETLLFLGKD